MAADNVTLLDSAGPDMLLAAVRDDGTYTLLAKCPELEAQFGRLLALLGLTEEERAFVRAALRGDDRDLFFVLADYLEERGHPASDRFRTIGVANGR